MVNIITESLKNGKKTPDEELNQLRNDLAVRNKNEYDEMMKEGGVIQKIADGLREEMKKDPEQKCLDAMTTLKDICKNGLALPDKTKIVFTPEARKQMTLAMQVIIVELMSEQGVHLGLNPAPLISPSLTIDKWKKWTIPNNGTPDTYLKELGITDATIAQEIIDIQTIDTAASLAQNGAHNQNNVARQTTAGLTSLTIDMGAAAPGGSPASALPRHDGGKWDTFRYGSGRSIMDTVSDHPVGSAVTVLAGGALLYGLGRWMGIFGGEKKSHKHKKGAHDAAHADDHEEDKSSGGFLGTLGTIFGFPGKKIGQGVDLLGKGGKHILGLGAVGAGIYIINKMWKLNSFMGGLKEGFEDLKKMGGDLKDSIFGKKEEEKKPEKPDAEPYYKKHPKPSQAFYEKKIEGITVGIIQNTAKDDGAKAALDAIEVDNKAHPDDTNKHDADRKILAEMLAVEKSAEKQKDVTEIKITLPDKTEITLDPKKDIGYDELLTALKPDSIKITSDLVWEDTSSNPSTGVKPTLDALKDSFTKAIGINPGKDERKNILEPLWRKMVYDVCMERVVKAITTIQTAAAAKNSPGKYDPVGMAPVILALDTYLAVGGKLNLPNDSGKFNAGNANFVGSYQEHLNTLLRVATDFSNF